MIERKKLNCRCSTCIYNTQGKLYKRMSRSEFIKILQGM